jgi:hypothetical protein
LAKEKREGEATHILEIDTLVPRVLACRTGEMPKPQLARGDAVPEPVLRQLRVPMIRKAALRSGGGDEDVFVIDIGLRGVFVERGEPLPVNERVQVRFTLPDNEIPVEAGCRVAWAHTPGARLVSKVLPAGVGLEFVEIQARDLERVRAHVVRYCRRHPKARQFHPNWPELEGGA